MLTWLIRLLSGNPIKWQTIEQKHTSRPALKWKVTRQNRLLIEDRDMTPLYPLSKADLEASFRRMKEKISASGHPIIIEALYVEKHIATGLWNESSINIADLQGADGRYHGITFEWELLGEPITLSIQSGTYYQDYEFIVRGHPEKLVRVRDLPDALAEVGEGEKIF